MKNQDLKKAKYRLLVLLDLSHSSSSVLRNALNLLKIVGGSIEVFHVAQPAEVVKYDNQHSAKWALDKEQSKTSKRLQDLINKVVGEEDIPIRCNISLGNVKNEIKDHIEKTNPDIVVLGKRNQKLINFLGNDVTQLVMNRHSGTILIAGEGENFLSNSRFSLGFYNDTLNDHNLEITKELSKRIEGPVKFFGVRSRSAVKEEKAGMALLKSDHSVQNAIEYEFEEGANALDGLANYVSKNGIGLLCVGRGRKKKGWSDRRIGGVSEINRAIQNLTGPLLIMGDGDI
jgi:nucleotide-binding universal stress UspA family protein